MELVKSTKPLYAEIAAGKYDLQINPETKARWPTQYSKGLSCDGVEIFVLSEELAYSAHLLAKNSSGVFMQDLSTVHLPYPKVVFEAPVTEKIRRGRSDLIVANGTVDIEKVGAYIEQSGTGFFIQPYWKMMNGIVEVTPIAFSTADEFDGIRLMPVNLKPRGDGGPIIDLDAVISPAWGNILGGAGILHVLNEYRNDDSMLKRAITEAVEELPFVLFAALALINCKSGVTTTRVAKRVAPAKCSAYLKRKLSSPAYTVLALSEVESVTPTGHIAIRSDVSAHYVRGHFKARRSGVYWWNPFVRGTGALRKRTAYMVKS